MVEVLEAVPAKPMMVDGLTTFPHLASRKDSLPLQLFAPFVNSCSFGSLAEIKVEKALVGMVVAGEVGSMEQTMVWLMCCASRL